MIFDKEPLHRAPRQYGFSPASCDCLGEFLSRYAEQSLDLEIRQVLLARPADKIVRPDIQETEAMPQVIFEPRQDLDAVGKARDRSEEHTSELQSLMRISYAVFCLKTKTQNKNKHRIN